MRFDVPALDRELGIEVYLTDTEGIGGSLRSREEDFVVGEIPIGASSIEEFASSLSRTPSRYENYTIWLLEKRGIDTLHAASIIAEWLHLKEEEIGYCGLKDAKAISRQLVSIPFRKPFQREYEFPEGIRLQLLGFRFRPLALGELAGNQFSITARKILLEHDELVKHLDDLTGELRKHGGSPGYFGYQRFGSRRPVSHLVGKMLYQDDLQGAVDLILIHYSETESAETRGAREHLAAEGNYMRAAEYFPEHLNIERRMLEHLGRHPKDFEGAMKRLPVRLRRLFYDAYQSFLYNKALSLRLRERKTPGEIQQGDLVASFDERGYVKKLTQVGSKNLAKILGDIQERRVLPVLAIPSQLDGQSSHPISPEVVSIIEEEGLPSRGRSLGKSKDSSAGMIRPVFVEPENLSWIIGEDEGDLGFRKSAFYFRLRRGFYATILLREFLKPEDPLTAGF